MIGVILAGGSGTRFWPMSRRRRPKQLIRLWGGKPMIEHAIDRLDGFVDGGETFCVLGDHLVDATLEATSLDRTNLIVEPCPRNTGPAIALAAAVVESRWGDEPFAVFPADHFIDGVDAFHQCLELAEERARNGHIVTLGIEPDRPETGYGYIEFRPDPDRDFGAFPVKSFKEKPSRRIAEEYLASGNYAWNSGMFVMTPSTLFDEMERQLPEMHAGFESIRAALEAGDADAVIEEVFADLKSVSIDYGIMEGARSVEVIPATFRWSDVGHWDAVDEVRTTDDAGNVVAADNLLVDCQESVVFSENGERLIAGVGLDEMVVVDTPDALLVMPRSRAQDVRKVVARLEELGRDDLL